jgi:glycosyltransferase involved in cell wall biosynthesis
MTPTIAVLIPCLNEELTIERVVASFHEQLPCARIYVYDNGSTDATAERARIAGAIVGTERARGKGNVVRRMFRDVAADVYVLVDGDGTYPAASVHDLLQPVLDGTADTVVGSRLHHSSQSEFRALNRIGNWLFRTAIRLFRGVRTTDLLSGYRVFTVECVRSFDLRSSGFEIETEITLETYRRGMRVAEVAVDLGQRPEGSTSKIRLFRDGLLVARTLFA